MKKIEKIAFDHLSDQIVKFDDAFFNIKAIDAGEHVGKKIVSRKWFDAKISEIRNTIDAIKENQ